MPITVQSLIWMLEQISDKERHVVVTDSQTIQIRSFDAADLPVTITGLSLEELRRLTPAVYGAYELLPIRYSWDGTFAMGPSPFSSFDPAVRPTTPELTFEELRRVIYFAGEPHSLADNDRSPLADTNPEPKQTKSYWERLAEKE